MTLQERLTVFNKVGSVMAFKEIRSFNSKFLFANFLCLSFACVTVSSHYLHLLSLMTVYVLFCLHNVRTAWALSEWDLKSLSSKQARVARTMIIESRLAYQSENGPAIVGYFLVIVLITILSFSKWAANIGMYAAGVAGFHLALSSVSYLVVVSSRDIVERVTLAMRATKNSDRRLTEKSDPISWWLIATAWVASLVICFTMHFIRGAEHG
jgi:hypothetical protein